MKQFKKEIRNVYYTNLQKYFQGQMPWTHLDVDAYEVILTMVER